MTICLRQGLPDRGTFDGKSASKPATHIHSLIIYKTQLEACKLVTLKQYTPLKFASPAIIARFRYCRIIYGKDSTINEANN